MAETCRFANWIIRCSDGREHRLAERSAAVSDVGRSRRTPSFRHSVGLNRETPRASPVVTKLQKTETTDFADAHGQSTRQTVSQCRRIAHFEQNFWPSIPSSQGFNRRSRRFAQIWNPNPHTAIQRVSSEPLSIRAFGFIRIESVKSVVKIRGLGLVAALPRQDHQ